MEDWIILNNNTNNTTNDNNNNIQPYNNHDKTNDLISQLDIEIENNSYEYNYPSNTYYRCQDTDFIYSSCCNLFNNIQIQIKTIQFYLLSIINDLKNLLY